MCMLITLKQCPALKLCQEKSATTVSLFFANSVKVRGGKFVQVQTPIRVPTVKILFEHAGL